MTLIWTSLQLRYVGVYISCCVVSPTLGSGVAVQKICVHISQVFAWIDYLLFEGIVFAWIDYLLFEGIVD